MQEKFDRLMALLGEASDLGAASGVLAWDQETYMPEGGAEARARQMATIEKLAHEKFTGDEVGKLLDELADWAGDQPYESNAASVVRVATRNYRRMTRVPSSLVEKYARARGQSFNAWVKARRESDYEAFRPHLEEMVRLTSEMADAIGYQECRYDALLDAFEPGMLTRDIESLFAELKAGLVPLARDIISRSASVDDSFLYREYPDLQQWEFTMEVLRSLGFDLKRGRQDRAEHPFTTSFSPGDVRVTTRIKPGDFTSGLFATIHEAGHGMYDQGIPSELEGGPLADGASAGVHESQSLMWENLVGRSRGFWENLYPRLAGRFPEQTRGISIDQFFRAINKAKPSLIRVDADEVTYNLHIFIRFELEQLMFSGRADFRRLPEFWSERMREYLGIVPSDDAHGILQDVHWSEGLFGYFPSYTIGHLLAVQFFTQAQKEHPQIGADISAGQFSTLLKWLNERIHQYGSKLTPKELVEKVTGGRLEVGPYLRYIEGKYRSI